MECSGDYGVEIMEWSGVEWSGVECLLHEISWSFLLRLRLRRRRRRRRLPHRFLYAHARSSGNGAAFEDPLPSLRKTSSKK
jgi:hypothetical protein